MSTGTLTSIDSADVIREEYYESCLEDLDQGDEMATGQMDNPQVITNNEVRPDGDEPAPKRARFTSSSIGKETSTHSEPAAASPVDGSVAATDVPEK
jgi:hypothetical protein